MVARGPAVADLPRRAWLLAALAGQDFPLAVPVAPAVGRRACRGRTQVRAALALPPVPSALVQGDLTGSNVLWRADGALSGVLDRDLGSAFDVACR
ncbi:hypothetical protein [Pseudokineococcus sp. 1T1Z-3]|uniref:hypothetical protein n=1 Tax=Pseudokineococcus sp. 1T1Z-3 TaxID=3132745 RepID=UPI00309A8722